MELLLAGSYCLLSYHTYVYGLLEESFLKLAVSYILSLLLKVVIKGIVSFYQKHLFKEIKQCVKSVFVFVPSSTYSFK